MNFYAYYEDLKVVMGFIPQSVYNLFFVIISVILTAVIVKLILSVL